MSALNVIHKSGEFVVTGNQAVRVVITDLYDDKSYVLMGNDLLGFNAAVRWAKNKDLVLKKIILNIKLSESEKENYA